MTTHEKPLTKSQVTAQLAQILEIPKGMSKMILEELTNFAVKETKRAGAFNLPGMGKVTLSHRQAREGRNPKTGEKIAIPAKTVVRMRLARAFKDTLAK